MDDAKLNSAKQKIYSLDLQPVIQRLVEVENWSKKDAQEAARQYRNYLFLRRKYPNLNLPPSKDIDEAWHAHVLHTEDYRKFCKDVFYDQDDSYLDHHPHLAKEGTIQKLNSLFEDAQKLYYKEFGSHMYEIYSRTYLRKFVDRVRARLLASFPRLNQLLED